MERAHFTHNYLLAPEHPITVNLIGAGGTGSQALTQLARMNSALVGLGHPGLYVTVYDPDIVSPTNVGRQMFFPSDVGQPQASCLVTRVNAGFGTDWQAEPLRPRERSPSSDEEGWLPVAAGAATKLPAAPPLPRVTPACAGQRTLNPRQNNSVAAFAKSSQN